MNVNYDAIIVGSGFSGSILGWILAKSGWHVAIVDRAKHPRFAIGESSTPTADFLLAYLADRWQLPELRPLAAWGTWQDKYPNIGCGKKRGFSYLQHSHDQTFVDDHEKSRSLMVAASQSDYWSDTHWLRSDVDDFLAKQASRSGCTLFENHEFLQLQREELNWRATITDRCTGEPKSVCGRWLIDAAGGDDFSQRWLSNASDDQWMKTKTRAIFSHFQGVASFGDCATELVNEDSQAGFHVDDAAQHHITEDGWMWMLRFATGVTSVGIVRPDNRCEPIESDWHGQQQFHEWIDRYPSIKQMMRNAIPVGVNPDQLRWGNRLSRCRRSAAGRGWIALPTAYGFVDPLHSTGIAHALSGVLRVAELLVADGTVDSEKSSRWAAYNSQLRSEVTWLDLLVGGCYRGLPSFESFCAYSAWYFVSAIHFERVMAMDPSKWPVGYMTSDDSRLRTAVEESFLQISRGCGTDIDLIRRLIAPWNDIGLLEPVRGKRIAHTAPPKYASVIFQR